MLPGSSKITFKTLKAIVKMKDLFKDEKFYLYSLIRFTNIDP
jgi:hypothetical protein